MKRKKGIQISKDEKIVELLQTIVAIEMVKGGLTQAQIGKNLGMAAGSVNKLIKGYGTKK